MEASPWRFFPPERQKGRIFYSFFNENDKEYPDVKPVLEILLGKFRGELLRVLPSPYNTPYEISVCGITVLVVEDNWPDPYLGAPESDALVLERLVHDLKKELGATDIGGQG